MSFHKLHICYFDSVSAEFFFFFASCCKIISWNLLIFVFPNRATFLSRQEQNYFQNKKVQRGNRSLCSVSQGKVVPSCSVGGGGGGQDKTSDKTGRGGGMTALPLWTDIQSKNNTFTSHYVCVVPFWNIKALIRTVRSRNDDGSFYYFFRTDPSFSQTHSVGINVNVVFPYNSSLLFYLYHMMLINVKFYINRHKDSRFQIQK